MPNAIDLIGQRFGKLMVLEFHHANKEGRFYRCICDCGNEKIVSAGKLRGGNTKSCGCLRKESDKNRVTDLSGQKFGKLLVLKRVEKPKGIKRTCAFWLCICDCGNSIVLSTNALLQKKKTSCGCLKKEKKSRNRINLVGQRFGKLLVLELDHVAPGGVSLWKCICDCGNERVVSTGNLRSGTATSCGCSSFEDLTGLKFGKLLVLNRVYRKKKDVEWLVRCECGEERIVSSYGLKSGSNISCGCSKREGKGELTTLRYLINIYKWSARIRGLPFNITDDKFIEIVKRPCFYCGRFDIKINPHTKKEYRLNGVDRIDSSLGYFEDNVVSCCKHCNIAKQTMSPDKFLSWISRVYNHSIAPLLVQNLSLETIELEPVAA